MEARLIGGRHQGDVRIQWRAQFERLRLTREVRKPKEGEERIQRHRVFALLPGVARTAARKPAERRCGSGILNLRLEACQCIDVRPTLWWRPRPERG